LVAQIEFTEWTPDGHLRHSKFVGLREDKEVREVRGRIKNWHEGRDCGELGSRKTLSSNIWEESMSGGIPLGQWSGSDATNALHETIQRYQETSSKQTAQMLRLTWAIAVLTFVMLIGLAVQIYLAIKPCIGSLGNG
jgi:hypothetical protein